MKALMRRISAYSGADLLLGVFTTDKGARAARAEYIARYKGGRSRDPWARQAYREGSLAADVVAERIRPCRSCKAGAVRDGPVTVVSAYSEGFGQVVREVDSAHASRACPRRRAASLGRAADPMPFPGYALLHEVIVDRLAPDAPEARPAPRPRRRRQ